VLALAMIAIANRAEAACDANGNPSPAGSACYVLKGSDTLFDIVTGAINTARTNGVTGATDLFYAGTGSGNAEGAMKPSNATDLGVQSIGPMSRNMRPNIIDGTATGYVAGGPGTGTSCSAPVGAATNNTACGHAAWAPTPTNVVGLDAAVFLVKNSVALADIDFTTFVDQAGPTTIKKGNVNNTSITSAFGNGGGFQSLTGACTLCGQAGQPACSAACVNYNSVMAVVLSGIDGSGTMAACSDPRRIQAIADLTGLLGVPTINHLFRRDDNSGTTDTFKDRIMVVANSAAEKATYPFTGGRFCNGQAFGGINGAAVQKGLCSVTRATICTSNASCPAGEVCQYNLNNQDFDPVRRPCSPADATHAPTSCTDWTTGKPCQAGDGNANCTQGLVVALSDTDPGSSDITNSIGKRVGSGDGSIMGYAGREGQTGTGARGLFINGIAPSDDNVRSSSYLLARRLFIQNSFVNSTATADVPTNGQNNLPATTWVVNGVVGGGTDQRTKEQNLWSTTLSNRAIMDPIVRQFGFIRCAAAGDGADPTLESNNLCALTPAPAVTAPLGGYNPSGALGGGAGQAIALTVNHQGRMWYPPGTGAGGTTGVLAAAGGSGLCVSGGAAATTGSKICSAGALATLGGTCLANTDCNSSGKSDGVCSFLCPDAALLPANAPCTQNSDCQASLVCDNAFGQSSGGRDALYCCVPGSSPLCTAVGRP
jgi:hypothetical protein